MLNHLSHLVKRHSLAGELTAVLAVKIALLVLASIFLFGADQRLHVDGDTVAHHMLDQNPIPAAR